MAEPAHIRHGSTVDPVEVERFARIADAWWDPQGKFAPLHRLNPVRIGFIRDRAADHWRREPLSGTPLQGLSLLDIGCGGGLLSEPMARLGATVTGIDAAEPNLDTARRHAAGQALAIDYRATTAEALVELGAQFDIVLALEVVEHVADVDLFLRSVATLARPGGLVFL
ncbi:MAG TPA: bifunctional 2-polyprenyl-6-hydroxyphenol methylase/3-demethylubiquinol 3-O-methyltransferase UbiG, partial [Reyranella sp.]|nr:bifunctional 2-polyprenyl-6-hydroxyphenol methylase/3-demethylubiquinol 3-O-methyltransferase UbiG [Reyranella sp.]